jgi:hypothetical protein
VPTRSLHYTEGARPGRVFETADTVAGACIVARKAGTPAPEALHLRGAPAARVQVGLVQADRMYGAKRDIVQALGLDIVQVGPRAPAPCSASSMCRLPDREDPLRSAEGARGPNMQQGRAVVLLPVSALSLLGSARARMQRRGRGPRRSFRCSGTACRSSCWRTCAWRACRTPTCWPRRAPARPWRRALRLAQGAVPDYALFSVSPCPMCGQ